MGKSFVLLFFKKEGLSFFEKNETKKLHPFNFELQSGNHDDEQ